MEYWYSDLKYYNTNPIELLYDYMVWLTHIYLKNVVNKSYRGRIHVFELRRRGVKIGKDSEDHLGPSESWNLTITSIYVKLDMIRRTARYTMSLPNEKTSA
jgi:hypothetical protein